MQDCPVRYRLLCNSSFHLISCGISLLCLWKKICSFISFNFITSAFLCALVSYSMLQFSLVVISLFLHWFGFSITAGFSLLQNSPRSSVIFYLLFFSSSSSSSSSSISLSPSLSTHPYHPSPFASFLEGNPESRGRADECKFLLVVQTLVYPCVGVHWITLLTSSSLFLLQILFVQGGLFVGS